MRKDLIAIFVRLKEWAGDYSCPFFHIHVYYIRLFGLFFDIAPFLQFATK